MSKQNFYTDNDKLTQQVFKLMLKNRKTCGVFQYTVPSPQTYPYQWFWDSCFHAVILSHCNTTDAKKELISVVSHQFENGMIPHMIYWDKANPTDFPVVEWGKIDTSTITQPPMLAYALWQIYQKDRDKSFLILLYESLKNFCWYLMTERKGKDNLLGIINPDESGEDNSPRFDKPLGLSPKHSLQKNFAKRLELVGKNKYCNFETTSCMSNFFFVKDLPYNAIAVDSLLKSAEIADILGKNEDKQYFLTSAHKLTQAMKKWMLDDGIFWSIYGTKRKKIKVKTWAIFMPLFAKICSPKEARRVVDEYLFDKNQFKTNFIIPTVSQNDPSYDPEAPLGQKTTLPNPPTEVSWRGPVWMATNWFIYKGLLNYGFRDEAAMILQSSLNLLEKSGFREYYHPKTGQGMGAHDFTWGGLVLDMLE